MIISDLGYLEAVSAEAITGGRYKPKAVAFADAFSTAIGKKTFSATFTETVAVSGVFSKSISSSTAVAKG